MDARFDLKDRGQSERLHDHCRVTLRTLLANPHSDHRIRRHTRRNKFRAIIARVGLPRSMAFELPFRSDRAHKKRIRRYNTADGRRDTTRARGELICGAVPLPRRRANRAND